MTSCSEGALDKGLADPVQHDEELAHLYLRMALHPPGDLQLSLNVIIYLTHDMPCWHTAEHVLLSRCWVQLQQAPVASGARHVRECMRPFDAGAVGST